VRALLRNLGAPTAAQETALLVLILVILALLVATLVFSAYALVLRARHDARERRRAVLTERWQEAVLRAVADPDEIPRVHARVSERHELSFVGFVLGYARRVRGSERETLRRLVAPYLDRVAERAGSDHLEVRARAIQTLGTLGLPAHAPTVIAALDDESPLVAMVAARALAYEGTPMYAEEVLARLARFSGWRRRFLASMLASMGPNVLAALRSALENTDVEPWVRAALADALLQQGDFAAGDVAARILSTSEDRELVVAALRLLGGVGRPEHVAEVRPFCKSADKVIRAQALRALGSLGGREEIPELVEAMSDPYPWAALYAARGVRLAGGQQELAALASSSRPEAGLAQQALLEGGVG